MPSASHCLAHPQRRRQLGLAVQVEGDGPLHQRVAESEEQRAADALAGAVRNAHLQGQAGARSSGGGAGPALNHCWAHRSIQHRSRHSRRCLTSVQGLVGDSPLNSAPVCWSTTCGFGCTPAGEQGLGGRKPHTLCTLVADQLGARQQNGPTRAHAGRGTGAVHHEQRPSRPLLDPHLVRPTKHHLLSEIRNSSSTSWLFAHAPGAASSASTPAASCCLAHCEGSTAQPGGAGARRPRTRWRPPPARQPHLRCAVAHWVGMVEQATGGGPVAVRPGPTLHLAELPHRHACRSGRGSRVWKRPASAAGHGANERQHRGARHEAGQRAHWRGQSLR